MLESCLPLALVFRQPPFVFVALGVKSGPWRAHRCRDPVPPGVDFKWDCRVFSVDFTQLQGNVGQLIILSTLCIMFPILLLQWGVILAPPFISALILAKLPAVVMATETLLGSAINPVQLMLLVLIVVITMGQAIHGTRQSRKSRT